jgi:hypothetical protein
MSDRVAKNSRLGMTDHDDFGSSRPKIMNVIDSNIFARDADGKPHHAFLHPALIAAIAVVIASSGLGGCADLGDGAMSGAFVDPAKYALYDCAQLDAQRKSLAARTAQLQRLIDKARTGAAGTVVAEVAYRNDYITTRASAKLAEEEWQRNKCHETAAPAAPAAPAAVGPGSAPRSGGSRGAVDGYPANRQ